MDATQRYDSLFQWYAHVHGISWLLLKAQAIQESALDPRAISPVGAKGLMQFMPRTWLEWWDETVGIQGLPDAQRINPEASIAAGAAYMAKLLAVFGELDVALAAYNWGWGRVRRHLRRFGGKLASLHLPDETRSYLRRIHQIHDKLISEPH